MNDLQTVFFERELSATEEESLAAQLEASDEACEAFATAAAKDYRASGFPDPIPARRRGIPWKTLGVVIVLGLGWALRPHPSEPPAPIASVDERPFTEEQQQRVVHPARPAAVIAAAPEKDRLDISRDAQGFLLAVHVGEGGEGRLELQDLQGQVLRSLFTGPLEPGAWSFRWEGQGKNGNALKPGQYRLVWVRGGNSIRKTVQVEAR
jgi:hypothetical protein